MNITTFISFFCNKRTVMKSLSEIDESNVSKEDMKDEYNETIADVDDGTMSEASDSERCEGVTVEEGVVGEAMRHVDKGTSDTAPLSLYQPASQIYQLDHLP
jgi:hypothetical protein